MDKRSFSSSERYAVFTCHGEKCYLCEEPVSFSGMQVDHIIPEHLLDEPEKLREVLTTFGLPADFNLNSYENWLPACECNQKKSATIFKATPIIQVQLQKAAKKADQARKLEKETISRHKVARALNTIQRAIAQVKGEDLTALFELHKQHRQPETVNQPFRITPDYEVISDNGLIVKVRGPFGIGTRPSGTPHPSVCCAVCGESASHGARCIRCGNMDDDM